MQAPQSGSANGNGSSVESSATASAGVDDLRAMCLRQAHVIDALIGAGPSCARERPRSRPRTPSCAPHLTR
jgi:hypothetical protein